VPQHGSHGGCFERYSEGEDIYWGVASRLMAPLVRSHVDASTAYAQLVTCRVYSSFTCHHILILIAFVPLASYELFWALLSHILPDCPLSPRIYITHTTQNTQGCHTQRDVSRHAQLNLRQTSSYVSNPCSFKTATSAQNNQTSEGVKR
jgi:hypothetical protein